jgi:4-hydroxybenzoyl-CoA thioesterase
LSRAPFTYRTTVRFSHTDPSATVYFPRFFEFVQAAAEDWFTTGLGIPFAGMIRERGIGQPTAHLECDFSAPSFLGDVLDISVYLVNIGRTSFVLEFVGKAGDEPRFRARSVQVMVSFDDGRPIPLPDDIRAAMEAYLAAVDAPESPLP